MRKPATIEYIEFARGYAIFTIVLYHLLQRLPLSPLFQKAIIFGGSGVHLFFLLSGFGLGLSKSSSSVSSFYSRRLVKVWLPYAIVLSLSWWAAASLQIFSDGWAAWSAGVFFYQMFFEKFIQSFGGHFWFISAIIQFYLLFPLLNWLKKQINSPFIFAALGLLISIIWWEFVFLSGKGGDRIWNSNCLQFMWEFTLGMALADVYQKQSREPAAPISSWLRGDFWNFAWWKNLLAGIFFTALMVLTILKMGEIGRIFNDLPALIGYTALSIFLFQFFKKILPPVKTFFLWIGGFSFSLYLIHILVLEIWIRFWHFQGWAVSPMMLGTFLIFVLGVAWAWEPVSRWFTQLFDKKISPTSPLNA